MTQHTRSIAELCVPVDATLRTVVGAIDAGERGIALVVAPDGVLVATITDGDVRRAMLSGIGLDEPAATLLKRRVGVGAPLVAGVAVSAAEILSMMRDSRVRQIPLVDDGGVVVDLVVIEDLLPRQGLPLQAVVMAGGFGSRLRPLTDGVPKPMVDIDGRPMLERIIEQLRVAGVKQVSVTTHYRPDVIVEHFGDGSEFGVDLSYVNEESPLGTAGSLRMLESRNEPILVINGDILTNANLRALFDFHQESEALMTVAIYEHEVQVPYGVVTLSGSQVAALHEKPTLRHQVLAGIYVLDPSVVGRIPEGRRYDMPDLISQLIRDGAPIVGFPLREFWQDIGGAKDYERAVAATRDGEV